LLVAFLPCFVFVALGYFAFGELGVWLGFLLIGFFISAVPGRGLRAKLDRFAQLDGQLIGGLWPWLPSASFIKHRSYWGVAGVAVLVMLNWGSSSTKPFVDERPPEKSSALSLEAVLQKIDQEKTSHNGDVEPKGEALVLPMETRRVHSSSQSTLGKEVPADGHGYDWITQRPYGGK
jgi:hypothetical protein